MTSSAPDPNILVIIVNFRRPEDTLQCIDSVLSSKVDNLGILLVDNGSQDGSDRQFAQAFPQASVLALAENLGFSGGYNAGIEHALATTQAKALFLLNNDTVLDAETVQRLVQSPWDLAVPKILYYDRPDTVWAAGARWRAFPPSVTMIGYGKKDHGNYDRPRRLNYATGCALMVRRSVFEKVGGFDPDFTNYMEDYDFSYRARKSGFTIGYVPEARVLHKVSRTLGAFSPVRWRQQGKNTVLFYRKENRFPWVALWSFLGWFTIRETVKANISVLAPFWKGVRDGLIAIQQKG